MFEDTALIKKKSPIVDRLNAFFDSEYAVGVLAFFALSSALFGLELYFYSCICLAGIYLCLFGRDFRFFVPAALYACVAISNQNNPNTNPESVLYPQNGLWLVIALAVVLAVVLVLRVAKLKGEFFRQKRKFLKGFLVLGGAFFISSFMTVEHILLNLRYSAVLWLSLVAMYYLLTATIDFTSLKKDYFAWVLFFLGLCTSGQLLEVYLRGNVIVDGQIVRMYISFGWGTYNNLGVMLLVSMPGAFYLATVRKRAAIFNLFGNFFYLCVLLSNSRTCMMAGAVVYFICMYFVLREKKNYRQNFGVFLTALILVFIFFLVFNDLVTKIFKELITIGAYDSGRWGIYDRGAAQFFSSPIFGKGFFASDAYDWWEVAGVNLLPPLWHNTFIQMLASCGVVGLLAYAYHRVQTFWHFVKNPTVEKTFLGICLLAFLLTNILDCHFFLLGPGLFYSSFLALTEKDGAGTGLRTLIKNK